MECKAISNNSNYLVWKNQFTHDYSVEIEYIKEGAKTIEINGVNFEIVNKHFTHDNIQEYMYNKCKTLLDCYKSCSKVKRDAYNNWNEFFSHLKHSCHFTIDSYNYNFFTLSVMLYDVGDDNGHEYDYMFKITRDRNIMYRIIY